jgi:beta-xylosidase
MNFCSTVLTRKIFLPGVIFVLFLHTLQAQKNEPVNSSVSRVWVADNGDGTYKNPIIHADYSDPDVIRVGADFYMVASSFNCAPGLPVLHSKDLVNWKLLCYAFSKQIPLDVFSKPQHGNGCWAPAIRFHKGTYYIYYPDPEFGIYVTKAVNPAGPWSDPILVKEAKGWIDPCPLWDDNGDVWLISALAGSRAGAKSVLVLSKMNADGTKVLDDGVIVFDGHANHPTLEGPKFYKRNGYYYISAPAGGVPTGWQLILRSKNIYGPYEEKIVLDQGSSPVNGPHQGGWVDTPKGEFWFIHFQDKDAYGRIIHLQPMRWVNDWPVMGTDADGNGKGEPVLVYKKPDVGASFPIITPAESDEFNNPALGLQWQWHANPGTNWTFPTGALGFLRMVCVPLPENFKNYWDVPNLFLQKFPAPEFTITTKLSFKPLYEGDKTGLIVMGLDYAYISLTKTGDKVVISQTICKDANKQMPEIESSRNEVTGENFYLRVNVAEGGICNFSFSTDGERFQPIGEPFRARKGMWIGAKSGIFASRPVYKSGEAGYADYDWFRVE